MLVRDLLETEQFYQAAVNHLSDGVMLADLDTNIIIWNDALKNITGYGQEDIRQICDLRMLDFIDRSGVAMRDRKCPLTATLTDGKKRSCRLFLKHNKGYRVPAMLKTVPVVDNKELLAVMATVTDDSIQVQQDDIVNSLTKLVMTDPLTGLSNRRHIETLLKSKMEEYRLQGQRFGVLFINLDDFTSCNENHGYDVGNHLLIALADQFRMATRESEIIGRWGGEEFVGVFHVQDSNQLKLVTENIRGLVERTSVKYMEEKISTTASVGATMADSSDSWEEAVERASSLMHVSKISGRNCVTIG